MFSPLWISRDRRMICQPNARQLRGRKNVAAGMGYLRDWAVLRNSSRFAFVTAKGETVYVL